MDIVVTRNGKEKSFKIDPNYKTYLFGFSYGTNEKAAAEVSSVTEGKPFEKAGFKAGDIIKEVNGKKIVNAGELSTAMNEVNSDGKEFRCMDPMNPSDSLVPLSDFGNRIYAVRYVYLE